MTSHDHLNAARAATAAANSRATDSASIAESEASLAIAYALLDIGDAVRTLAAHEQSIARLVSEVARLRGVPEQVVRLAQDEHWAEDSPRFATVGENGDGKSITEPEPAEPEHTAPDQRLAACVEAWPDCAVGEHNPACCRFPKACSCLPYDAYETRIALTTDRPAAEPEPGGSTR